MLISSDSFSRFRVTFPVTFAILTMTACTNLPAGAMVSDFNGSSVKVRAWFASAQADEDAATVATATCKKGGKATAELASSQIVSSDTIEYLFICS